jgi:uncharacterized protein YqjF (DUF2071 family)
VARARRTETRAHRPSTNKRRFSRSVRRHDPCFLTLVEVALLRQHLRDALTRPEPLLEERMPWLVFQSWQHLLFLHWRVPVEVLRPLVPDAMSLELFEGQAWVTMIPMVMVDVRVRGLPARTALTWPEVNFRTYVRVGEHTGITFLSIDASSRLGAWSGRRWGLPLVDARMSFGQRDGWCSLSADRPAGHGLGPARFAGRWRPVGPVREAIEGTLEHFHAENELMFMQGPRGTVWRGRIWHPPWPLQDVEADIAVNTVPDALGLSLGEPDLASYLRLADTIAWPPLPVPRRAP